MSTPKSISDLSALDRYRLNVAQEVAGSNVADAWTAHVKARRRVGDAMEESDTALLRQSADAFFQPAMPADARANAAKKLLQEKATQLGYKDGMALRHALAAAFPLDAKLDVSAHLKTLPTDQVAELVVAAMLTKRSDVDTQSAAKRVGELIGEGAPARAALDTLVENALTQTFGSVAAAERGDAARERLGKELVPFNALSIDELARELAGSTHPSPFKDGRRDLNRRVNAFFSPTDNSIVFGDSSSMHEHWHLPEDVLPDAGNKGAHTSLPTRARFKELPIGEQYNAILGAVVLGSYGVSTSELHTKAEKIFDSIHPHRAEPEEARKQRRITANRTILVPGQAVASREEQVLQAMRSTASACGLASAQELLDLVTSMAGGKAILDAELHNAPSATRYTVLAAAIALTDASSAAGSSKRLHELDVLGLGKRNAWRDSADRGVLRRDTSGDEVEAPATAQRLPAGVAARLSTRLSTLGLPRDEAAEKAAVDALFAVNDPAQTTQLAREQLRAWTTASGLNFSSELVEELGQGKISGLGKGASEASRSHSDIFSIMMGEASRAQKSKKKAGVERASRPVADILAEVDSYAGWEDAKAFAHNVATAVEFDAFCRDAGLPSQYQLQHLVLKGPPGTGKTTFAKLYAELLHAYGVLPANQVTRAKATDLVSRYLGGTSHDTQKVLDAALGGVLFIDEIYRLARIREYGQEAIDAINEFLDEHRDEFVCVVTGYTKETQDFLASNPGLKDRFGQELFFPAFSSTQMENTIGRFAESAGTTIAEEAWPKITDLLGKIDVTAEDFASGRTARKLFEEWRDNMKARVVPLARAAKAQTGTVSAALLTTITAADIKNRPVETVQKFEVGFLGGRH